MAAINLKQALGEVADDINETLDELLPPVEDAQAQVFEAMRYSALAGGKRLRPFLTVASADLFDVPRIYSQRAGVAAELIHTYSLVHDDLPAMDDDDLRRGMATCHKKYDEATAILVGDGLQSLAFEILADEKTHHDPRTRCQLVHALAAAAGGHGMVGGQMIDLSAANEDYDIGAITRLQQLKTGALIAVSCEMGAILGHATEECHHALRGYAHYLGLAFQIADDLLDHEGSEADMGKAVGKDAAAGKATFVSLLGVERARTQARMLIEQAVAHLDHFGERAGLLQEAARYVVERKS